MDKAHEVGEVSFRGITMLLHVDGRDYEVDISSQSPRLASATPEQRQNFVVSPSEYGIHWPDLDEDLSVDGLIGIKQRHPLERTAREVVDRNSMQATTGRLPHCLFTGERQRLFRQTVDRSQSPFCQMLQCCGSRDPEPGTQGWRQRNPWEGLRTFS
ncbi:MAG: DUF2442 domain-containing protein [Deltaproteobacteria bacterium]|nr:DUF2442 domain-containing protein [Deltaproteobacteria bacterium]